MTRFLIAATLVAMTAPASAASLLEACETDIATYCAKVEPGNGRISACLYAHEDKVSDACDAATAEMSDVMDMFFSRMREMHIACGADVAEHCGGVAVGGGRIMACLREAKVSDACSSVLQSIDQPDG